MGSNDLPNYPTPQQMAYATNQQPQRRTRPAPAPYKNELPPATTPGSYGLYYGQNAPYQAPGLAHSVPSSAPSHQSYQSQALAPSHPQSHALAHAPAHPPTHVQSQNHNHSHNNQHQNQGQGQNHTGQGQYFLPPTNQQPYYPPQHTPQYQQPPPPAQSAGAPQYNYAPPYTQSPEFVLQSPPTQQVPVKKPPSGRSRENLGEISKTSSKQRLESELRGTFERVDTNGSGRISTRELSAALSNFDNTRFQESTVRLMIKLFTDESASGLNFDQFVLLWKYLTAYKKLFVAADTNHLGDILFGELLRIIEQIGYKLNVDLVLHLFLKFANKDAATRNLSSVGKLKFDAFIELLVYLRKLTDIFKKYDKDLLGVATINYLDFLFEISNLS